MAHQLSPVQAVRPSQRGALAGFESRCSCGLVLRSSLRSIVELDVVEHLRWAESRKAAAR